jgi:hypothetical protein
MTDDTNPLINVNVDSPVSFKAVVKAEIRTEVSKESASRLVDALTDAIRPFTEARGLRADQIRLQREDVLIEIAKKGSRAAADRGSGSAPGK